VLVLSIKLTSPYELLDIYLLSDLLYELDLISGNLTLGVFSFYALLV
jgi:hypothetical protein